MACGDIARIDSEAGSVRFGAPAGSLRRSQTSTNHLWTPPTPQFTSLKAYELLRASQRRCDSQRAMSRPTGFYIGREWSVREKEIER